MVETKEYEINEMTVLSMLLFSERANTELYEKLFRYTKEDMFFDYRTKAVYKLLRENYKNDADILGSEHFAIKIASMLEIEKHISQAFILDIKKWWLTPVLMEKYIRTIQDNYFNYMFENAKNELEYQKILLEKDRYLIVDDMQNIFDGIDNYINDYDKRKTTVVKTPYDSLNDIIGSLQGGDMVVLAGGTGGGKTCMMLNLVTGMAKEGKKIDIFSLEMPREQLQQRMICSEASIDASKFRSFTLTTKDKEKYIDYANNVFSHLNIRIYKKQTVSIEQMRYIVMKSDADIVFIDYLGLINSYANKNTYERFSEISRNIKLLAMQSNKPIVALHQLNREFQNREDKKPRLSDIRDSGKIEQDADMVWFVHRPGLYEPEKFKKEDMHLIVAKNRFGKSDATINLLFNGTNQRITEPIKL